MYQIEPYKKGDDTDAYRVCLETGNHGDDGTPFYREDPDALGRIYVGPYLKFEPELALMLHDDHGVCGYSLGALDTRGFHERYETEWRPDLCARFPDPTGPRSGWSRVEQVYHAYHHPDYFVPAEYHRFPAHLHIDLIRRAQGQGMGRQMMERLMAMLKERGAPGVHLGMSASNERAYGFYMNLGFEELARQGEDEDATIYLARPL